jgi:hypothetical protein
MNNFDWNQFEPVEPIEPTQNKPNQFDWNQFEFVEPSKNQKPEPSALSEGIRHVARTGSDVANALAGIPANLRDFVGMITEYGEEKLPESLGKPLKSLHKTYQESPLGKAIGQLPTTSDLEKKAQERSGGYLTPQSEKEEFTSEVTKDIASFFGPGTGKLSLAKKIGVPLAGALTKLGVKYAGGSEKEQAYAKLGVMLPLTMMNPGGAKKHAGKLFSESEKLVPESAMMHTQTLIPKLHNLKTRLEKGGSAPSKTEALKKISEIQAKVQNHQMPVHDALQFRKDINEILERAGGFDVPKAEKASSIKNLNEVKSSIISSLNEYGKKNKAFGDMNRAANESYAVIENSNRVSRTIEKALNKPIVNKNLKHLLGVAPYVGAGAVSVVSPGAAVGLVGGMGIYNSAKLLERIGKSPELRRYYGNILAEGLKGNVNGVSQNLQKLDRSLSKEKN